MAIMAVVGNAALLVFAYGFISLIIDRDVIEEPDAGPLVGPAMVVTTCAVVLWFVLRRKPRGLGLRALAAALGTVIAGPAVGAVVYGIVRDEIGVLPVFFGRNILSPFVLCSGLIAALIVAAAGFVENRR